MPGLLGWAAFLAGLLVVAACVLLPREIGKEADPLVAFTVDLPPVETILSRLSGRARRRPVPGSPPSGSSAMDTPAPVSEAPRALGAQQPVLAEDGSVSLARPAVPPAAPTGL